MSGPIMRTLFQFENLFKFFGKYALMVWLRRPFYYEVITRTELGILRKKVNPCRKRVVHICEPCKKQCAKLRAVAAEPKLITPPKTPERRQERIDKLLEPTSVTNSRLSMAIIKTQSLSPPSPQTEGKPVLDQPRFEYETHKKSEISGPDKVEIVKITETNDGSLYASLLSKKQFDVELGGDEMESCQKPVLIFKEEQKFLESPQGTTTDVLIREEVEYEEIPGLKVKPPIQIENGGMKLSSDLEIVKLPLCHIKEHPSPIEVNVQVAKVGGSSALVLVGTDKNVDYVTSLLRDGEVLYEEYEEIEEEEPHESCLAESVWLPSSKEMFDDLVPSLVADESDILTLDTPQVTLQIPDVQSPIQDQKTVDHILNEVLDGVGDNDKEWESIEIKRDSEVVRQLESATPSKWPKLPTMNLPWLKESKDDNRK